MTIKLEYTIDGSLIDVSDLRGGWNMIIDGERVARYADEETFEPHFEWHPAYVGEFVHTDLMGLLSVATQIASGGVKIYETVTTSSSPAWGKYTFEPLSDTAVRVAFRRTPLSYDKLIAPESACGYVVDRCELCQAVSEGAHRYVSELRAADPEWGIVLLEECEESLAELDEALETCAETPPPTESADD